MSMPSVRALFALSRASRLACCMTLLLASSASCKCADRSPASAVRHDTAQKPALRDDAEVYRNSYRVGPTVTVHEVGRADLVLQPSVKTVVTSYVCLESPSCVAALVRHLKAAGLNRRLKRLRLLMFDPAKSLSEALAVVGAAQPRVLELRGGRLSDRDVVSLARRAQDLESLDLRCLGSVRGQFLADSFMTRLQTVRMQPYCDCTFGYSFGPPIELAVSLGRSSLVYKLKKVAISNVVITKDLARFLGRLPTLEHLVLVRCEGLTKQLVSALTAHRKLKRLQLISTPLSGDACTSLARSTTIQHLTLAQAGVDAGCLSRLASNDALRTLGLVGNKLGGGACAMLSAALKLESLEVDGEVLTRECVRFLPKMKSLRHLELRGPGIDRVVEARLRKAMHSVEIRKTRTHADLR